ncbi:MAG TPA: CPBP family intramembrane glutamic endopeptidase [Kineosporiaceae bacterium]|nr:CPBP family intramembrane glutamic endopeptidase [Kineosporiaceae bacterium]
MSAIAPDPADVSGRSVMKARRCFLQAVVVLAAFTVARALGLSGPTTLGVAALIGLLILVAWRARASLEDVGLHPARVVGGVRWGAAASGAVLAVLVLAAALPATRGFLHDARAQIDGGRLAQEILVSIAVLTAVPEEFAFRGVLLGSGLQLWGRWRAVLVTSGLFGLWHIAPTLATMTDNPAVSGASATVLGRVAVVAGAVTVTFVAGLAFAWLRLRSGSLVAPVVAHVATNGLALAAAWVTLHWAVLA